MTDKGPIPFTAEEEVAWAKKEVIADKKRKEEMEEYERVKYQRDRKPLYGTWEQQLDMMYHGTWKDHVAKIKRDIPKENK